MNKFTKILLACALLLLCSSCDSGTVTGNPLISLAFDSFNPATKVVSQSSAVTPLTVNNLQMCFKRLRFKRSIETTNPDPTLDEDNVDFEPGLVTVNSAGTDLGDVNVPAGTYERLEFDLEDDCGSGYSLLIGNDNVGSPFSTTDRITIKFEGSVTITASGEVVLLGLQAITSALNTVVNDAEVKTKAESASGVL